MKWQAIALHRSFLWQLRHRRRQEMRAGYERQRDQTRPDLSVFRPGFGLQRDREDSGRLFQDDQRAGRLNGRKINLITLDDAYSPPKTVEQTRKLVGRKRSR
jgi:hypothetical protein